MSDFNSSLPVRTEANGDVVAKIVDGTVTSQALGVDSSGRITIKLQDGGGTSLTSQTNGTQRALDVGINVAGAQIDPRSIRTLTAADVVTANQGTAGATAWLTTDAADGSVAAGTAGTKSMLGGLVFNTSAPTLTNGQQVALQGDSAGNLFVNLKTAIPTGANTIGAVTQAAGPWTQNLTQVGGTAIALGQTTMSASLPVTIASNQTALPVTQSTSPWVVSGTVTANQGTANATPWNQNVSQFGGNAVVTGTGVSGAGIPRVTVSSDSAVLANIQVAGSAVTASNPVPVSISSTVPGSSVINYNTAASVAAASSSNHIYTVTASKTLNFARIWASASGKLKIEVQVETGVATGVYATKFVGFNSTAAPNIDIAVMTALSVAAGVRVQIIRTNLDKASEDVYSTIEGTEV